MSLSLSGIAVSYLLSIFLAPLFHQHPGEQHSDSTVSGYHSHAGSTKSHAHTEKNASKKAATSHHSSETITPFHDMVGVVQVNPDNNIKPAKFSLAIILSIQSSVESCAPQFSRQNAFQSLPPPPRQDYCVQSATNLSPPQV